MFSKGLFGEFINRYMKKSQCLVFLIISSLLFSKISLAQIIEAETAVLSDGARIVEDTYASGGYFVALDAGNLSLNLDLEAGNYDVLIRVSSPHGRKINGFLINGSMVDFGLPQNALLSDMIIAKAYKLEGGNTQIEVKGFWGWINIDYIIFNKTTSNPVYQLNHHLVNPAPAPETKALYDFFLDHYGRKILSGIMTLSSRDESDWLKFNFGKEPVILGLDLMNSNREYDWYDDTIPLIDAENWYARNGIPALMWHWRDPSRLTEAFYTSDTEFDVSKIFDQASSEYQSMISDIDYVSEQLKYLQGKGVPVLWRPLHEAAGGWFWWGAKGPEALKELYQVMYNRMVNYHGLDNLIWIWTMEPGDNEWYPGNGYVDIVGRDLYRDGNHTSHALEFNHVNYLFEGKKILSITECSSFPNPNSLKNDQSPWSWFMPWYGSYTENEYYNPMDLWNLSLYHDYVLTLDEMPYLPNYVRQYSDYFITGLDHLSDWGIKVYPTYIEGYLTVESNENEIKSIIILNSQGQKILELSPDKLKMEINFKDYRPGMYFIMINHQLIRKVFKN